MTFPLTVQACVLGGRHASNKKEKERKRKRPYLWSLLPGSFPFFEASSKWLNQNNLTGTKGSDACAYQYLLGVLLGGKEDHIHLLIWENFGTQRMCIVAWGWINTYSRSWSISYRALRTESVSGWIKQIILRIGDLLSALLLTLCAKETLVSCLK